jgi:hypothetical protein
MGYLINPNPLANYKKVIIPESDLQSIVIGGSYFITTNLGTNKFWFVTFAAFRLINSTVNYDGFSHITLKQTGGNSQGVLETSSNPTPGEIEPDIFYTFAYNQQHSPNKLGAYSLGPRYAINFDGTYISGNGDLELHFYYNEINI